MVRKPHRASFRRLLLTVSASTLILVDTAFAAFTMTEIITPGFGTFVGGASGRQFILNTNDTITGTDAADYLFGAASGLLELKKTAGPASANITAENISTTGGLSVNAVLCQFRTDPQTTCSGSGINVTLQGKRNLRLGINVTTTQIHGGGDTASVSMDITVTFL